jgi:hypothetical protein
VRTAIGSWIIDWREERLSAGQWFQAALFLALSATLYCLLSGAASGELSRPSISIAWGVMVAAVLGLTCCLLATWRRAAKLLQRAKLPGAFLILIAGVALLVAGEKWLALVYWQQPWTDFAAHFVRRMPLSLPILAMAAFPSWLNVRGEARAASTMQERQPPCTEPVIIEVQTRSGRLSLDAEQVVRIVAAGNYVELHTGAGCYLLRATLASLSLRLAESKFARVHRSVLVNHRHVSSVKRDRKGEWVLQLVDGVVVRVGRRYREAITPLLDSRFEGRR